MNRLSKSLFVVAASLATTYGTASAQDAPPPDDTGGGDAGGGADAGGGGDTAGGTGDAPAMPGDGAPAGGDVMATMYTAATWPKSYVDRPQNAAKGMIEVTPTFGFYRTTTTDPVSGMSTSDSATSINVAARYGITDKIEALFGFGGTSVNSGIPEHGIIVTGLADGAPGGDRFKGDLKIGAGISVLKGKLDVEVKAAFFDDLLFKNAAILAGADVRYHVTPKLWVGTPTNRPGLTLGVKDVEFAGMSVPGTSPIRLSIPVAVAFQATPELALQVNTRLFDINLNDDAKVADKSLTLFGQDEFGGIPLDIDVLFALNNKMDVVGNLNLVDLKNAGDFLVISGGVNIRM